MTSAFRQSLMEDSVVAMNFRNPFFIIFFALCMLVSVSFVIALVGGWFELGRVYRATRDFAGTSWRFQDAQFRLLTGYNNILTVGSNAEGLYLAVFFSFRIGHPPLFIPWQDVSVRLGRFLWIRVYKFEFRQVPSVHLRLREKLGKKIQIAAGSAWPGDRGTAGSAF
jgi:hypothetical protein